MAVSLDPIGCSERRSEDKSHGTIERTVVIYELFVYDQKQRTNKRVVINAADENNCH